MDGSCNNLQKSFWGKSRTQFQRCHNPVYFDGVWQSRKAVNGNELPRYYHCHIFILYYASTLIRVQIEISARLISTTVAVDVDAPHETDTNWVAIYGQFVDHDLTLTPVRTMGKFYLFIYLFHWNWHFCIIENGMGIQCCTEDGKPLQPEMLHRECLPIAIPPNDPFFSRFGHSCMSFVRSTPAPRFDCSIGHGEQVSWFSYFKIGNNQVITRMIY